MAIDEKLKEELNNVPVSKHPIGKKPGECNRCGEFRLLVKSPWEDAYTGTVGMGWLCEDCVQLDSAKVLKAKYTPGQYYSRQVVDLSKEFHPWPKPKKADRKKKA